MILDFFSDTGGSRSGRERLGALSEAHPIPSDDYLAFGYDYFDNPSLGIGYGGYCYDGRYREAAVRLRDHYGLALGSRVLEVGCAKGYLAVELARLGLSVTALDASEYALVHAHDAVRGRLVHADVRGLPFADSAFDLVVGKEVLPHLPESALDAAIDECVRVGRGRLFFEIQCGKSEAELEQMRRWDATHRTLRTPGWWSTRLAELGYPGDVCFKPLFPGDAA